MPLKTIATGRGLMGGGTYADKVLGYGPIAYWPLWETSGTVANCLVNSAQNGTYSSDVSTWPVSIGIGDGNTAPNFDGTNDWINIFTAAFQAAWNGDEFSILMWKRAANAGVWTDGNTRHHILLWTDWNNYTRSVTFGAGTNEHRRTANAVFQAVTPIGLATAAWIVAVYTASVANNRFRLYWNGPQFGADQVGLNAWVGALNATGASIGGRNVAPAGQRWQGQIAHVAIYNYELTPGVASALSTV